MKRAGSPLEEEVKKRKNDNEVSHLLGTTHFQDDRYNEERIRTVLGQATSAKQVNKMLTRLCQQGDLKLVQLALNDKRSKPTNEHLQASVGHIEVVKMLLKDERVRPTLEFFGASVDSNPEVATAILSNTK